MTQLATLDGETQQAITRTVDKYMPVMGIDDILQRHALMMQFSQQVLREGTDYGKIPGCGDKPTLLKPGAEKLCTLFGLTVRFKIIEKIEDWTGADHDGIPFFYYLYRCQLWRGDYLIAESDGSANSHETKYRYRNAERLCPQCGKPAIIKGKAEYGGGFLCYRNKGGCGAKFQGNDAAITGQVLGKVENPDTADTCNTLLKMSQKRALVAATLVGVNASEFFTQDIEDFVPPEPAYRALPEPEPPVVLPPGLRAPKRRAVSDAAATAAADVTTNNPDTRKVHAHAMAATLTADDFEAINEVAVTAPYN